MAKKTCKSGKTTNLPSAFNKTLKRGQNPIKISKNLKNIYMHLRTICRNTGIKLIVPNSFKSRSGAVFEKTILSQKYVEGPKRKSLITNKWCHKSG